MNASETLDKLIAERKRKAVLRSELLKRADASASSCDRALKNQCERGTLVRVGQGIYGVGRAKVFEIVPEVMPKLGYQILPVQRVKGYSQKSSGRVWRLDKPCRRQIRKKGVQAIFEVGDGVQTNRKEYVRTMDKPNKREIEDHYHNFDYCHSLGRAEKDLIVHKALDVLESCQDGRANFAIDGGTAIAYYYNAIRRFSEDLDVRLILDESYHSCSFDERVETVKSVGLKLKEHFAANLPFLRYTKKGRIRKDGVVQSFIFDYTPDCPHDEVVAGLKIELVHTPVLRQVRSVPRNGKEKFSTINLLEIVAGKWQALAQRFLTARNNYPDLIRHVHDLAMVSYQIVEHDKDYVNLIDEQDRPAERVFEIAEEVRHPYWAQHYENYMKRMGTAAIADHPLTHPTWENVLSRFEDVIAVLLKYSDGLNE